MKTLLTAAFSLFLLNSCVFEFPFEPVAKFPVEPGLLGRWEQIQEESDGSSPNRMLVLQNAPNDYVVEYPIGEKAMFFRAFIVELEGAEYIQIQLIGNQQDTVKPEDRKFHLLKVALSEDRMEMSTIDPEVLGKDVGDSTRMKAALAAHKDDPGLFEKPDKFRRIK